MLAGWFISSIGTPRCRARCRHLGSLLLGTLLLGLVLPGRVEGQQPEQPGPPVDQALIDQSVMMGVEYLRNSQNADGSWGTGTKPGSDGWMIGYTALAGLTLVECGVSPNSDTRLKLAAQGVRLYVGELERTYEVALTILFLDRMGDKADRKLIQLLAGRLIAGQSPTGGWGYKVPKHQQQQIDLLYTALRKLSPTPPYLGPSTRERPATMGLCIKSSDELYRKPPPPPFDFKAARASALAGLPATMKRYPAFQDPTDLILEDPKDKGHDLINATTDNSNTHFAMLALLAARRHDVPTERSLALIAQRFRTSQGKDGTWGYGYLRNGQNGGPTPMTCAALLGIAIGHVIEPDPKVRPEQDPRVVNAFTVVSRVMGEPAGRTDNRPTVKAVGGLYMLWAMERIAVLYDVRQLGKKDWHKWGAEILICHQDKTDGSWQDGGGYPGEAPIINTCFALLFLRRANLTPELSRRLTVDASALTDVVAPKPIVTPTPKPPAPTLVVETAPPPRSVEPRPKPEPTPVVKAEPTPTPPSTPAPESPSKLPWILGGIAIVLILGLCLFLALRKRSDEDEEEQDKPKKKKRRTMVDEEDEEEQPKKKRREVVEEDEEEAPRKKSGKTKSGVRRPRDED